MGWMQTYYGYRFYPENVAASGFCIEDIAHALSNLCRFGGHAKRFYSVAQHSVLVADIVKAKGGTVEEELWALLHDATEAYMVDVPTPVKAILSGYKEKELEVQHAIQKALELPALKNNTLPHIIKEADGIALITEALQLVNGDVSEWDAYKLFKAHPGRLPSQAPRVARDRFLARWLEITTRYRKRHT